jgi:hypothetical protein
MNNFTNSCGHFGNVKIYRCVREAGAPAACKLAQILSHALRVYPTRTQGSGRIGSGKKFTATSISVFYPRICSIIGDIRQSLHQNKRSYLWPTFL